MSQTNPLRTEGIVVLFSGVVEVDFSNLHHLVVVSCALLEEIRTGYSVLSIVEDCFPNFWMNCCEDSANLKDALVRPWSDLYYHSDFVLIVQHWFEFWFYSSCVPSTESLSICEEIEHYWFCWIAVVRSVFVGWIYIQHCVKIRIRIRTDFCPFLLNLKCDFSKGSHLLIVLIVLLMHYRFLWNYFKGIEKILESQ